MKYFFAVITMTYCLQAEGDQQRDLEMSIKQNRDVRNLLEGPNFNNALTDELRQKLSKSELEKFQEAVSKDILSLGVYYLKKFKETKREFKDFKEQANKDILEAKKNAIEERFNGFTEGYNHEYAGKKNK